MLAAEEKSSPLPSYLRFGLPVLIVLDLSLLLVAHVCKGAITRVAGEAPLGLLTPHIATEDNLFSAIGRLAGAGAFGMVIIVALLSGLWPYVKLLGTLYCVALVDFGRVTKERSRQWLVLLEAFGKWSFADVFLIGFNLIIFDIHTRRYQVVVVGSLQIDLWMELQVGAVALIVAITASACITHWATFELSPPAPRWGANSLDEGAPLVNHTPSDPDTRVPQWRKGMAPPAGATLLALVGLALLVVGAYQPVVRITRGGFLGKLINEDERDLELSVFGMLAQMYNVASRRNEAVVYFFAFVFGVVSFWAPLFELLLLSVSALLTRWSPAAGHWSRTGAEWLNSIDCVDVLLIVGLVTVVQLAKVVEFNIGSECDSFEPIMNDQAILTIAGLGFASSDECFTPTSQISTGFWILLCAVLCRMCAWCLIAFTPAAAG